MYQVKHVLEAMEAWAPSTLAESWDNVGLLVGRKDSEVRGIMTGLDVTEALIDEAETRGANVIVTHHPLIFSGIKRIETDSAEGAILQRLLKADMAVIAGHTNVDIAEGGLNDVAAQRLGLKNIQGLLPVDGADSFVKIVVFVPKSHEAVVTAALGDSGAGHIGKYSHCAFKSKGQGQFKPEKGANPFIGSEGQLEEVDEVRVETIVSKGQLGAVVTAMLEAHPYEEVAYDVYPLLAPQPQAYLGRVGRYEEALSFEAFTNKLKKAFPKARLRYAGKRAERIERVGLCTGAGVDFMKRAKAMGCDAYVTGDVKYHEAQKAEALGILLVDAGHFGTEHYVAQILAEQLCKQLGSELPIFECVTQKDSFFYE